MSPCPFPATITITPPAPPIFLFFFFFFFFTIYFFFFFNYLIYSWEDKGVHTFPKGICPKVNVIARLKYELAYYDSAVHRFNHYTTMTLPLWSCVNITGFNLLFEIVC